MTPITLPDGGFYEVAARALIRSIVEVTGCLLGANHIHVLARRRKPHLTWSKAAVEKSSRQPGFSSY